VPEVQSKPYIKVDDSLICDMIPKPIKLKISREERESPFTDSQSDRDSANKKDIFFGLKARDPPSLLEKRKKLRQQRPTQFACEIEKTIYNLLQEGKLPNAYTILSTCRIEQVLLDKGIRTCTIVWSIDASGNNQANMKEGIIDKLDGIRHVLRYELGQRLCFRSVPDIIFTGN